jgi:phage shock protein E
MKILLPVLLLLLALTAQAGDFSYNGVKPAVIIDVRTPEEFASGHIDGAVNIPYEQIGTGIRSIRNLPKDSPILLYCRSGRRSAIARASLEQQGYRRVIDGGGLDALAPNLKACTNGAC